jgi:hypothetical protein
LRASINPSDNNPRPACRISAWSIASGMMARLTEGIAHYGNGTIASQSCQVVLCSRQ